MKVSSVNQNSNLNEVNLQNKTKYSPSYLASQNKADAVSFQGKQQNIKRGVAAALAALLGIGAAACEATKSTEVAASSSEVDEQAATQDTASVNSDFKVFDTDKTIDVVSIMSTVKDDDEKLETRVLPNALRIIDDEIPGGPQNNSTTYVVRTHTNEADTCTNLREAINKQYVEPFKKNGDKIEEVKEDELHQIAREIIENNEDMQKAIEKAYGTDNWMSVSAESLLDDDIYEWGVTEFNTPDVVEIHPISTVSNLYDKSESKTTIYSTNAKTLSFDNSIKTVEDLYSKFASVYKDADGNSAGATASSVATWLTIRNNQYNEAFSGKINNDGDRTDLMLLDTLKDLKDGETLTLDIPSAFGVNLTASGKSVDGLSEGRGYHIIHEMSPSDTNFTLDSDKVIKDCEDTKDVYDFIDILTYYYDPDTGEKLADKIEVEDEDGNKTYEFTYNTNVADLNAKAYSLYEQFAYDHIDYFAGKQTIDVDGKESTFDYGVFDVKKGCEQKVKDAIAKGDYDTAKNYLEFNLDRFIAGSFYNSDGTLKTGDLQMSLAQYLYVNYGEGSEAELPDVPADEPTTDAPSGTETPIAPVVPSVPHETNPTDPSNTDPIQPDPTEPATPPVTDPTTPTTKPTEPSTDPSSEPTEPSTPSITDPTDPSSEPTEPSTPPVTDPTEPSTPSITDPTEPSTPPVTDPTEPSTPPVTDPTEPSTPSVTDPTEPSTPPVTDPTEPSTPPVTDPTEPTDPTRPPHNPNPDPDIEDDTTAPVEPSTPPVTDPTEPSTPPVTDPTEPTDPTRPPHNPNPDPDIEDDTTAPVEPTTPPVTDPTEPSTPPVTDPTEPSTPPVTEPTDPTDPTVPSDPECEGEEDIMPDAKVPVVSDNPFSASDEADKEIPYEPAESYENEDYTTNEVVVSDEPANNYEASDNPPECSNEDQIAADSNVESYDEFGSPDEWYIID